MAEASLPTVGYPSPGVLAVRLNDREVVRVSGGAAKVREEDEPAEAVFLGYPHGPKTGDFVPAGRRRHTLVIQLKGPIEAQVSASGDSFACNDRPDSTLGSVFGAPVSTSDNGVYDRTDDWLVSAEGGPISVRPLGQGRYDLKVGGAFCTLRLRSDYYRDHLGYFFWDRAKPLWKQPISGWCSWMAYLQGVKEQDMLEAARFFAAKDLKAYGYSVIQMDDGYQRVPQFMKDGDTFPEPFSHYWTIPNEKFPSGLKALASGISELGLTPGIWVGDYLPLGLKHAEGYTRDPDGKPHKGPWVNYAVDALLPAARDEAYLDTVRTLRKDGWRYFKIDTLRHVLYDNYRQVPEYWKSRHESMEEAYRTLLRETKKTVGNNYLLACWGTIPELAGIPDGCRIGEDVGPDFDSMRRTAKYIAQFQHLNDVVWRNDPDYMCLRVPVEQAQTWATMDFLAGGHLMVSDPVSAYDEARLDVMRRVGPPLVTRPASVATHGPDPEFMTLAAQKGGEQWAVVARFGWTEQPEKREPVQVFGLDPNASYLAFDFWNERFLGTVHGQAGFEALKQGACQAIAFRPLLNRPQILGTNRHLSQGAYELEAVRWSGATLSGRFRRGPGREWSVYVHVPAGWRVLRTEPDVKAEANGEVLKLTFPKGATPADFRVAFAK